MSHKNKTTPTKILKLCQTSRIDLNKSMNGFVEKRKYDKRLPHLVGYTRCARLLFLESIVCIVILKQQVNSIIVQEQHYKRKTTYIRFLYAKIRPFEYTRMVGYAVCQYLVILSIKENSLFQYKYSKFHEENTLKYSK